MNRTESFHFKSIIDAPAAEVFDWHCRPGAIFRLVPPWEPVDVVKSVDAPTNGATAVLRMNLPPFTLDWVACHEEFQAGKQFVDVQVRGPFEYWRHVHKVEPISETKCALIEEIEYSVPMGRILNSASGEFIRSKLNRMFKYRHAVVAADVQTYIKQGGHTMKILVTGSHGLVGSRLIPFLQTQGHTVVKLTREAPKDDEVLWDPKNGSIDKGALEGLDAVIHLAGESIADGRWTDEKKTRIKKSRVDGTKLLCDALAQLNKPPKVIVSASAIGFYGDRGAELLNEESPSGSGFLADVCREWEAATKSAKEKGIRVALLRIGVVLTPKGGALAKMLMPFQMGAGGKIGSGDQYMSWISIDDLVGVIHHILTHNEIEGPVNAVAPNPVTNARFTESLGAVLHRPTILPLPKFAAHMIMGEMADELLLSSARVMPNKLLDCGYNFHHRELDTALKQLLGKN